MFLGEVVGVLSRKCENRDNHRGGKGRCASIVRESGHKWGREERMCLDSEGIGTNMGERREDESG